ncbi:DUF6222 family protein [Amycolatopsis sp. NPDC051071]|uniref:DUF6222 family protein n=1 Tax=Amycolatopsis sp. NPDC051071 TaxID=3154637 RepID=UPI00342EC7DA
MTANESATVRSDETPPSVHSLDRPPVVTTMPRLGRGVCWRDIVREIEADELEREARLKEAA